MTVLCGNVQLLHGDDSQFAHTSVTLDLQRTDVLLSIYVHDMRIILLQPTYHSRNVLRHHSPFIIGQPWCPEVGQRPQRDWAKASAPLGEGISVVRQIHQHDMCYVS